MLEDSISMMRAAGGKRPAAFLRPGFTLVELFVVVAITAVLATVALVASQNAKIAANRAKCASNMRQLGVGLISYATENNGRLPGTQHYQEFGSQESWVYALREYIGGDIKEIRICPADPKGPERARNDASSYILNNYLDSGAVDIFGSPIAGRGNLVSIRDPSRSMMLFIVAESKGVAAGNDHIHGAGWTSWPRVLADIQPDRHRRGDAAVDHTKGSGNYLFVDGRVESIPAAEIKRRVQSGVNIALPPQ